MAKYKKNFETALQLTFFLHLLMVSLFWLLTSGADRITQNSKRLVTSFNILNGGYALLFGLILMVVPFKILFSKHNSVLGAYLTKTVFYAMKLPKVEKYRERYAAVFYCVYLFFAARFFLSEWSIDPDVQLFLALTSKIGKVELETLIYWEVILWLYFVIHAVLILVRPIAKAILIYFQLQVFYFIAIVTSVYSRFISDAIFESLNEKYELTFLANEDIWRTPIFCCLGILMVSFFWVMDAQYKNRFKTEINQEKTSRKELKGFLEHHRKTGTDKESREN